jgi:hypothetical protein
MTGMNNTLAEITQLLSKSLMELDTINEPIEPVSLLKAKMMAKYLVNSAAQMENRGQEYKATIKKLRRECFYKTIAASDKKTLIRIKKIVGEEDFDCKVSMHAFTDQEILSVMNVLEDGDDE